MNDFVNGVLWCKNRVKMNFRASVSCWKELSDYKVKLQKHNCNTYTDVFLFLFPVLLVRQLCG